jgi:hypothetical protein
MNPSVVRKARELMRRRTRINGAPSWLLTEMAVAEGARLAGKYRVDAVLMQVALYGAHTVFSPVWQGRVQSRHEFLSAKFMAPHLKKWGATPEESALVLNAIQSHHDSGAALSKFAVVMRNAECVKFVSLKGALVTFHEFGLRGLPMREAAEKTLAKMRQKRKLLTLPDCKKRATWNCRQIEKIFRVLLRNNA